MSQVQNLTNMLANAEKGGYGVGSFSPRYTKLIRPIIEAAIACKSPVIIQLSEIEVNRHVLKIEDFANEFYRVVEELDPQIPIALHLDHTKTFDVIKEAIANHFTSVMIDKSALPFEENLAATKEVVAYAKPFGVTVEAELGKIGTTDFVESDKDEELYTDPEEAKIFCEQTGIDCLAVSVGTAHGAYTVRQPKIDFERVEAINAVVNVPLVLHGGSGVPDYMVTKAVELPTGGVSKVNIATDVELAMLHVVGRTGHLTEAELNSYPEDVIEASREAVKKLAMDKITNYLHSAGKA